MRQRTQRILISLLAFLIAGFAMANAYTFEVLNWSPFGVLNLQKLIIKQSTTSTGIILDGTNYTIKIDPEHETNGGQIRVYEICDESGNNCREVSSLGSNYQLPEASTDTLGGVKIGPIGKQSVAANSTSAISGKTYRVQKNNSGQLVVNVPREDTDFYSVVDGQNGYICTKSGDDLDCTKAVKLGTMSGGKVCYYNENTKSIECTKESGGGSYTLEPATYDKLGGVYLGSDEVQEVSANNPSATENKTYPIQVDKNGKLVVNVPRNGNGNGGNITIITGKNTQYCYSEDGTTIVCNTDLPTPGQGGANAIGQEEYICVKNGANLSCNKAKLGALKTGSRCTFDGTNINCTESEPSGGGNGTTIIGNSGQRCKYICDKTETQGNKVVCVSGHVECNASEPTCQGNCEGGDGMISGSIGGRCRYGAIGNGTALWDLGDLNGTIKTGIICTMSAPSGDSLWQSTKISVNNTTSTENLLTPKNTNQDLYLGGDIWHDGALTIKTLGASNAARENTVSIYQHGVAIGELPNKTAGLGVHGPISVGKYMLSSGEQSAAGHGGQCTSTTYNTISIYASGAGADEHFEILGTPRILIGVTNGAYMYFVGDGSPNIGINTQNTHATLNIDGSIRIGSCSNNNTCNSASAGEIKYYEKNNKGYFVGCRKTGTSSYERVILSDGTQTTGANNIGNSCNPPVVPYSGDVYGSQGMLMQQQANCQ